MCDNCIFGWLIVGTEEYPIAHHIGIILKWNKYDALRSIIAHYGPNGIPKVFVETLYDAVLRSRPSTIYTNSRIKAKFKNMPYHISNKLIGGIDLIQYEKNHPEYNVVTSNCQHFVQYFTGIKYIESDLHKDLRLALKTILPMIIYGNSSMIPLYLRDIMDNHIIDKCGHICNWDTECIDIDYNEI